MPVDTSTRAPGMEASGELKKAWAGLRRSICPRCNNGDGKGACRLDPMLDCPLQASLPLLLRAVNQIRSEDLHGSLRELLTTVCDRCQYNAIHGYCEISEFECVLVRHFPRIVKSIRNTSYANTPGSYQISAGDGL